MKDRALLYADLGDVGPYFGAMLAACVRSKAGGSGIVVETKKSETFNSKNAMADDDTWRESIRKQMEDELNQRVREALATPPLERQRRLSLAKKSPIDLEKINAHILLDLTENEQDYLKSRRWKTLQAKRQMRELMKMNSPIPKLPSSSQSRLDYSFHDELSKSNQAAFPGVFGLGNFSEGIKDFNKQQYGSYSRKKHRRDQSYTKDGFLSAINRDSTTETSLVNSLETGYMDKYGVVRSEHGPFWPVDYPPIFPTPKFSTIVGNVEPLYYHLQASHTRTVENQDTQFTGKWRGVQIVFDSERSSRENPAPPTPHECCPSLTFESRFESGNLRQARRMGQFEYELVLRTDLYTERHTQWFYFRVHNAIPGITYKFRIVNLLKRDSLYNYGMRPLLYSDKNAKSNRIGWHRAGHHISYSRNILNLHCPLLMRGTAYHMLEWQMEFPNADDTYYLAHSYPYTFTDLKDDLEAILTDSVRRSCIKREVLCETRAGNSCFLLTVTNFENQNPDKKYVVLSARVHPGETNASWMMSGVIDFITGSDPMAKELRDKFVFKIVPMLNPDGVIVGNYRCSLTARDLNRNYRHPRKESFPTVWHTKNMVDELLKRHEVVLYCDLHGHSRKSNVFMYGNNTAGDGASGLSAARAFLQERLFPWLMAKKAPDKFSFNSCKFQIKRCKEATGRVVMWRQLNIVNSFTLEATFSGTTICRSQHRHFNINDFKDMGKVLCHAVLDYSQAQENKTHQTEIVLEMTRQITHQILQTRGMMPTNLPNFSSLDKPTNQDATGAPLEITQELTSSEKVTEAILNLLNRDQPVIYEDEKPLDRKHKDAIKSKMNVSEPRKDNGVESASAQVTSKMDIHNLIDNISVETMDGCLKILAQLNVRDMMVESDSSDSDSDSESEMKSEHKTKKKKRKSRKHGERKLSLTDKLRVDDMKSKSVTSLPSIGSSESEVSQSSASSSRKQMSPSMPKLEKMPKAGPLFTSKYEGRTNGGIPCFSEERSLERAAKRMTELKKRGEEERHREMTFYYADESYYHRMMSIQLHRTMTQEDIQHRLHSAMHDGTSNIANTLSVKTGYTHADKYSEVMPTSSQIQMHQWSSLSTPAINNRDTSAMEGSDSELDTIVRIPLPARSNPYQQDRVTSLCIEPRNNMALCKLSNRTSASCNRPKVQSLTMPPLDRSFSMEQMISACGHLERVTDNKTHTLNMIRPMKVSGVRHSSCEE